MFRLIVNIIALVILAVFVSINMSYQTTINLFGYKYENISTVAVIIIALVIGVLYSFFYYLMTYISKSEKIKIRNKDKKTKLKEKELKDKEKNLNKTIEQKVKENTNPAQDPIDAELEEAEKKDKKAFNIFKPGKNK